MRLEHVGRRHGLRGPWALREVSLDLPAAALVRVVGTNGTGKSTLLRLIAGIDAPTEGRVTGRPARTAYVPERFPVALPFTAVDYLVHLGRVHGLGRAAARARAGEWLERFGVEEHAGTGLAKLSKGTSQKVAVAQALLADPALLVLDEAWTGLDTGARAELDTAVRERLAAGAAVVFVDHDPRRLEGEAAAVYGVEGGRVRGTTPPGLAGPGLGVPAAGPEPAATGVGLREARPGPGTTVAGLSRGRPEPAPAVPLSVSAPAAPRPSVRIVASGGRPLPGRLPGGPAVAPGTDDDTLVLTVDAAHSDALLGALLAASWHIHHLGTEGVRV
ncbi:ATP-binding cassette domain-containing protein [Streptomyces sp. TLI_105]|uniref:ATP-binding cassette domain-containing protein n=1 Tax=Streptomyces sp. TLI_105 TaxID=1881019 RepID=UPI00089D3EC6|nr:ATP-binding cassette domain-containing protein [Streptomyces sp. TLI_105]SEC21152.1 ABC-type multidrug transport system, ATPase component [Streptomyces sp. TLI_105]